MKIIVDTNIWYDIGEGKIQPVSLIGLPLVPTFCSVEEVARTENLKTRGQIVQSAIRSMMLFNQNLNMVPPFLHIAKMCCDFEIQKYVPDLRSNPLLELTQTIANQDGIIIPEEHFAKFDELRMPHFGALNRIAENFNSIFNGIAFEQWNEQFSESESSLSQARDIIERLGEHTFPDGQVISLKNLDFGKIELFHKTMNQFMRDLIKGGKMRKNDLYDIINMAYVQPGDLYWTRDKNWLIRTIKAGCENYLFTDPDPAWSIQSIKALVK